MAKIFQTAATKYLEPYRYAILVYETNPDHNEDHDCDTIVPLHSRMSLAQKAFLGPYFGLRAMMDPTRGDMVAALGDTLGERAARAMLAVLISVSFLSR